MIKILKTTEKRGPCVQKLKSADHANTSSHYRSPGCPFTRISGAERVPQTMPIYITLPIKTALQVVQKKAPSSALQFADADNLLRNGGRVLFS